MIQLALCACLLLFTAAFLLWDRLGAATKRAQGSPLAPLLKERIDRGLLDDPRALEIPHREPDDPYRTVGELLDALPRMTANSLVDHERRIKALYQLQGALELPEAPLAEAIAALRCAEFLDRPVGRVEVVAPGDLVDRAAMWPLTCGARVRQPLGVIVRNEEGRVISRAKVICG